MKYKKKDIYAKYSCFSKRKNIVERIISKFYMEVMKEMVRMKVFGKYK